MREINFEVNEQRILKKSASPIVRGSKGYLKARFHFSNDWKGFKKIASFYDEYNREHAVRVDSTESCMVPDEVTDGQFFIVKLTGVLGNSRITTHKVKVRMTN